MNQVIFHLQLACQKHIGIPKKRKFQTWLNAVVLRFHKEIEITIRLVDKQESRKLNFIYCGRNKPTNILSFLLEIPFGINIPTMGDLVICQTLVEQESKKQNKILEAHWAHVVIHGTLHLLGYDHMKNNQAKKMESLETEIMLALGYKDPFSL